MDIVYDQRINKIWKKTPPSSTCNRPNDVQEEAGSANTPICFPKNI